MAGTVYDRRQVLAQLAAAVPEAAKRFERATGRFLADNGGWAVTLQDAIFPLALLHQTPGHEHTGSAELLRMCRLGGDALRAAQDRQGRFEFIKIDGTRWGKIYMPWSIYHWLETHLLLRDTLDPGRRREWEKGLTLAYRGVARDLAEGDSTHNIPTWHGMSLARAAQVFDEPDWMAVARRQVRRTAAAQHEDGYWIEGDGPTVGYNLVYLHAISLYETFTGDESVLPALRRAIAFHTTFSYPDGTAMETVDGRQRYKTQPNRTGWPGLMREPRGRALVRQMIQTLRRRSNDQPPQAHLGNPSPHLASAYQHWRDGPVEPLPQMAASHRRVHRGKALVRREGKWCLCVSGYSARPHVRPTSSRKRYHLSRNNLLSIWHQRLGLLVGGGNSKNDPRFATFELWRDGAWHVEPDRVTFSQRGAVDSVRFHFGDLACVLRSEIDPAGAMWLTFEVPAATRKRAFVQAGMSLRLTEGERLRWETVGRHERGTTRGHTTLDATVAFTLPVPAENGVDHTRVRGRGWSLTLPPDSQLSYPVYPYDPYAIDDASAPADATANVYVSFTQRRRQSLVLADTSR